jgi:hypothetical protein
MVGTIGQPKAQLQRKRTNVRGCRLVSLSRFPRGPLAVEDAAAALARIQG